ncbi:hypothetical protein DV515_00008707, partial [Chloebia gouldiae]
MAWMHWELQPGVLESQECLDVPLPHCSTSSATVSPAAVGLTVLGCLCQVPGTQGTTGKTTDPLLMLAFILTKVSRRRKRCMSRKLKPILDQSGFLWEFCSEFLAICNSIQGTELQRPHEMRSSLVTASPARIHEGAAVCAETLGVCSPAFTCDMSQPMMSRVEDAERPILILGFAFVFFQVKDAYQELLPTVPSCVSSRALSVGEGTWQLILEAAIHRPVRAHAHTCLQPDQHETSHLLPKKGSGFLKHVLYLLVTHISPHQPPLHPPGVTCRFGQQSLCVTF